MDRTPLCYYSSEHLMEKVALAVENSYIKSSRYAELREALKRRLRIVCWAENFIDIPKELKQYVDENSYEHDSIQTNILFYDCHFVGLSDLRIHETSKFKSFIKKLKKRLQTSLNNLDKAWGYYGLMGYGMNYGYNHIEMGSHK